MGKKRSRCLTDKKDGSSGQIPCDDDRHGEPAASMTGGEASHRCDTEWPENRGSFLVNLYRSWSYAYMYPILKKGKGQFKEGQHLSLQDLYPVPENMEATFLVRNFRKHYEKDNGSLLKTLWNISLPTFRRAALWESVHIIARVSLPLSLRQLLIIVEGSETGSSIFREAIPYVVSLTAASTINALAQNRTVFLCTQSGISVRATLTSIIYEHALKLSPTGRKGLTTGEVTNLVAVDTQKLYDVLVEIQNTWSCPVLVVVVTALLWNILGPELVIGVVMLILFLPLIETIVSTMLRIRKERSKMTDVRINLLTSMLQGIRVTKLNHYEKMVESSVSKVRDREMKLLRRELRMWGLVLTMAVCSPLLAFGVAVTTHVLIDPTNILKPSDAFSALLLFSILRFPINMTARLVGKAAQALDSLKRIDAFLKRETQEPIETHPKQMGDDQSKTVLTVDNGHFIVDSSDAILDTDLSSSEGEGEECSQEMSVPTFSIREVSFTVKKGQLLAVVGQVGAGKTTLLRALLGEIPAAKDCRMELQGKISYSSQQPFILNATVKENILFGSPYDEKRYEDALDACCLRQDIQRLGDTGDLTQIGERGVTLSGGQKQRMALCRAVYANPDIALLDDCFSALDSNTSRSVFDSLFSKQKAGILRNSGTVLVTHALQLLPKADLILVMKDGSPAFLGTWLDLQKSETSGGITASIKKDLYADRDEKHGGHGRLRREGANEQDGIIMTVEEREYGIASFYIWILWFKHAGGWTFFISQMMLLLFDRGFYVASDWWIAVWSGNATDGSTIFGIYFPPQIEGIPAQAKYVTIYAGIILLSVVATLIRSLWAVSGGATCANTMFRALTKRVLRARMSYFETTPLGRIVNRFTYDVEVLDIELSVSMTGLMISWSWLMSSVVVMVAVLPWCAIALVPVGFSYYFMQLFYRMSGPDLQRIDATSRSPLQATLAEGLEGLTIIRAFRKQQKFAASFRELVNDNSSAMMNFLAAQRWLGVRIEILSSTMCLVTSMIVVSANDVLKIPAGLVGLLIQWAVIFTAALNFFFLRLSESEARLTSIERIQRTSELGQEASWDTDPAVVQLEPSWPSRGELEFDHVSMRYREELPLALESISFKLSPGTRCGVVGRTGSGKTSLTSALFRVVEIESGRIMLDGVDLAKIGLTDVRGRPNGMRIIPQDPVLFSGTLRDCLDPFGQCEADDRIVEALQAVNHKGALERGVAVLTETVEEGGSNLSVGERQLLCLARAIVEEPRVLVLDEATASIDTETDTFIQKMLRSRFRNTTLLTIAHRLYTIMDYDNVIVMNDGKLAEFGPPRVLLEDPGGLLSTLVNSSGPSAAEELRGIANGDISS